jgi:hypothetical protein
MFEPNAVAAAEAKKKEEEHKAENARIEAEMRPKAEREMTATANLMADMGKQLADNPRMARLFQLASQKSCKLQ